jgi:hypothetical protein
MMCFLSRKSPLCGQIKDPSFFVLQELKNVPFPELIQGDKVVGLPKQTAKWKSIFEPVGNDSRTYGLPVVFIQLPDIVDIRPLWSL